MIYSCRSCRKSKFAASCHRTILRKGYPTRKTGRIERKLMQPERAVLKWSRILSF